MSIVITHNYRDSLCRTDPLKGKSCIQKKKRFSRERTWETHYEQWTPYIQIGYIVRTILKLVFYGNVSAKQIGISYDCQSEIVPN